ncbi:MAG: sulfotransferase [Planctomycetota bacterium]
MSTAQTTVHAQAQQALGKRDPEQLVAVRANLTAYVAAVEDDAEAWFLLALVEQRLGNPAHAAPHAHRAQRLQPEVAKHAALLGDVLAACGRVREAGLAYQSALNLVPTDHNTLRKLGECFLADGDFEQAVAALRCALEHKPGHGGAWFSLAQALHQQGHLGEATSALHRVLARQPRNGGAYVELGRIAMAQARLDDADRCFRHALAQSAPMVANRIAVGHLYARMGEEQKAVAAYRSALAHEPAHPEALEGLAFLLRGRLPAADTASIAAQLGNSDLGIEQHARLHYSEVERLTGDAVREQRLHHAAEANRMQLQAWAAAGRPHGVTAHRRYVDTMIGTFDDSYFEQRRGFGVSTTRPVFIVGMPRSGTSLVEQILSSHPDVFGAGELLHIGTGLESLRRRSAPSTTATASGAKQWSFADAALAADKANVQQTALDYAHRLSELDPVAARVTDKLPLNFLNVGWIHTLFPHATIIHCQRDPRDVAISCYFKGLARVRWSADLGHIAEYVADYRRLMAHWDCVLPDRITHVRYEDLVSDLEGVSRRLVAAIDQPWTDACLAFHENRRSVCTASVSQVRNRLYTTSVGRWREYEELLAPYLGLLNP